MGDYTTLADLPQYPEALALVAAQDIAAGTCLLRVPFGWMVSTQQFDESPLLGNHRFHISLADAETADLRKKVVLLLFARHPLAPPILSRFAKVCDPASFDHIPLLWSNDDEALSLCGPLSAVKAEVQRERREVSAMRSELLPLVEAVLPTLAPIFTVLFCRVAVAVCNSRVFQLDYEVEVSADDESKSENSPKEDEDEDEDEEEEPEYRVCSQRVLVPGVDLMNHAVNSEGRNVETRWAVPEDCDVATDKSSLALEIFAVRAIAKGEELCHEYHAGESDYFLLHYGFVPDPNPDEVLVLSEAPSRRRWESNMTEDLPRTQHRPTLKARRACVVTELQRLQRLSENAARTDATVHACAVRRLHANAKAVLDAALGRIDALLQGRKKRGTPPKNR